MTFLDELQHVPFDDLLVAATDDSGDGRLDRALSTDPPNRSLEDFAALLSPAAGERLEELARASQALTRARFGRTMRMYAPLYLSNECLTTCTYCGFAKELPIARKTLSVEATLDEARFLRARGFRHLLLLTGEHERITGVEFLEERITALAGIVPQISTEVQVWNEEGYRRLNAAGCDGVVIYQETYNPETYARVHVAGRKRSFEHRLGGPERAAAAGMRRLGIGALYGLHDDWRYEAIAVAAHARFLQTKYWRAQVNVSVPRIRPSASGYQPSVLIGDREMVQLVCALRLFLPDAGLVSSTREQQTFRDGLFKVGITHASAGSHTEPGGYEHPNEATEQFEIADLRSPAEVAGRLRELGIDPVWGDWSTPPPAAEMEVVVSRLA